MAADRGAFIDQSQSFNVHMEAPTFGKLTSMHFHAWRSGLKTGMYYLRTQAARDAIKFTVDQSRLQVPETAADAGTGAALTPAKKAVNEDDAPKAEAVATEVKTSAAAGFSEITEEQAAAVKACSLDDPDCIACSA